MRFSAFGLVGSLCCATGALAQAPFTTDDAGVTGRHGWHFELFDQAADLPAADAPATSQNTLVLNVGFGLAPGFELGCDLPWITIAGADVDGGDVRGVGDLNLYLKWRFYDGSGGWPAWAAVAAVETPTGDETRGLGSGVSDQTLNVVAEWLGLAGADLRANLGIVFAGNSKTGEVGLEADGRIWTAGVSLTREGERLALGGELTGARGELDSLAARELRLQLGGRWAVSERLGLAAGAQRGWYATPPWQLQLGLILDL